MVFLFYDLLGIIVGTIDALFYSKSNTVAAFASRMLLWEIVIGIGALGIICFIGHVLASERVAEYIGWQSNYFQKELGFAELGMGLIAIMSLWQKSQFIDCSIIIALTTCIGATCVRITDLTKNKNRTRGNILSLLPDLFIPFSLITLKILSNV